MDPPRPQETSTGAILLSNVKESLKLVMNIADGGVSVPFLKPAMQIAIQIIESAELMKRNREDCLELGQQAGRTILCVHSTLQGARPNDIAMLQSQLGEYQKTLSLVLNGMRDMKNRKRVMRFLARQSEAIELVKWKNHLNEAYQQFVVCGVINTHIIVSRIYKEHQQASALEDQGKESHRLLNSKSLPTRSYIFHGRDTEVAEALKLILDSPPGPSSHLAILGSGGIGKTSLLLAILHHSRIQDHFKEHIYFVSCESAASASLLLSEITSTLGVQKKDDNDPLNSLKTWLQGSHRLLLALDNFETPYDQDDPREVLKVLGRIMEISHVTVILTMRGNLPPEDIRWDHITKVQSLSHEASKRVFLDAAGIHQNEEQRELEELLKAVDHIPLAITLLSYRVKQDIGPKPMARLLKQWKDEKRKTSLLRYRQACSKLNNIEVSIELSLRSKLVQNAKDALRLLSIISYLPDGIPAPFNQEGEAGMEKWEAMSFGLEGRHDALLALLTVGLLDITRDSLTMLSPVRHYISSQYPMDQGHKLVLESYYIALIAKYDCNQHSTVNGLLEMETANIIHVVKEACKTEDKIHLELFQAAYGMSLFLYHSKPSNELLHIITPLATKHKGFKFWVECKQLVGNMQRRLCHFSQAEVEIKQALQQCQERGYKTGEAQCLQSLGEILQMQDRYTEAREHLQEALGLFKDTGDRLGEAQCMQSLGEILRMQDSYTEAREYLQKALGLFENIGNRLGKAQCMRNLGNIVQMQGSYTEAMEHLQEALGLFKDVGDKLGEAQCMQSLGNVLWMQESYIEAREHLQEALRLFKDTGDRLGEAQCMHSLGDILQIQNSYTEAREHLQEALGLFRDIGDRHGEAQCMHSLGEIFQKQDSYTEAREHMLEASGLFKEIGDRHGEAQCMHSLSEILQMQDSYTEAREHLQEALGLFKDIGNRLGEAQCLQSLGEILQMQDSYTEAREHLEEALRLFKDVGHRRGEAQCMHSLSEILQMQDSHIEAREHLQEAVLRFNMIGYLQDV